MESDSPTFDQFKQREEAAILTLLAGIASIDDWNDTIALIGELRKGRMIPEPNPNSSLKTKPIRIKENTAWLHKNLLSDEDDWNRVKDHLQSLRLNESTSKQEVDNP
jgi:hypothetical protein